MGPHKAMSPMAVSSLEKSFEFINLKGKIFVRNKTHLLQEPKSCALTAWLFSQLEKSRIRTYEFTIITKAVLAQTKFQKAVFL